MDHVTPAGFCFFSPLANPLSSAIHASILQGDLDQERVFGSSPYCGGAQLTLEQSHHITMGLQTRSLWLLRRCSYSQAVKRVCCVACSPHGEFLSLTVDSGSHSGTGENSSDTGPVSRYKDS